MSTTLEIVEKYHYQPPTEETSEHLRRLAKVNGGSLQTKVEAADKLRRLAQQYGQTELGWPVWIVGKDCIAQYRYHAQIGHYFKPGSSWQEHAVVWHDGIIIYKGDIPDFALDKMEKVKRNGIEFFTIHSNRPLPVERVELKPLDPILVGWADDPGIDLGWRGKFSRMADTLGLVIAAWDMDKELL